MSAVRSIIDALLFYEGYLSAREVAQGVSKLFEDAGAGEFKYQKVKTAEFCRNALASATEQHA